MAGKTLPAVGVGGIAADPVVHREAGVTPLEHAFSGTALALGGFKIESDLRIGFELRFK